VDVDSVAKWGPLAGGSALGILCFLVLRALRDIAADIKASRERAAADAATAAAMLAILPKVQDVLTSVQVIMAGLLEHERFRLARKMAREAPQSWDEETQPFTIPPTPATPKRRTDPMGMPIVERVRTPKGGV
jgi:hypothetical protein